MQSQTPQSGGITALGVYVLGGVLFDFSALFEYAYILMRKRQLKAKRLRRSLAEIVEEENRSRNIMAWSKPDDTLEHLAKRYQEMDAVLKECNIDRNMFYLYLLAVFLFNVIYFLAYMA